jgi:hypothetical protein
MKAGPQVPLWQGPGSPTGLRCLMEPGSSSIPSLTRLALASDHTASGQRRGLFLQVIPEGAGPVIPEGAGPVNRKVARCRLAHRRGGALARLLALMPDDSRETLERFR